jgi:hypothetical protein
LLIALAENEGAEFRYFRVAAQTDLGTYKFAIAHTNVPEWMDVEPYCVWHNINIPRTRRTGPA